MPPPDLGQSSNIFNGLKVVMLGLTICLTSCSSENDIENTDPSSDRNTSILLDKDLIEQAPLENQLLYLEHHLLNLGNEFTRRDISLNDYDDLKKSSNSKDNFYAFEDLFSETKKSTNSNLLLSLNAFKNLDGSSWKPVISKIKDGKKEDPLFLIQIFDVKTKKEIVQGYKLNANGQLTLKYQNLTEEDVMGSTSKGLKKSSTDLDNITYALMLEEGPDGGGGGGGGGSSYYYPTIQYL